MCCMSAVCIPESLACHFIELSQEPLKVTYCYHFHLTVEGTGAQGD